MILNLMHSAFKNAGYEMKVPIIYKLMDITASTKANPVA